MHTPPGPQHPAPPVPAGHMPPGYAPGPGPGPGMHHPHHRPPPKRKGIPWWAILLIIMGASVPVLGILAAIAIPAFSKYMRRSRAAEAKVAVAQIFDGASSYFAAHDHCVGGEGPVEVGPTPNFDVNCNDGPGGRCLPGKAGPGAYAYEQWSEDPLWQDLGFAKEEGHHYRYAYKAYNEGASCQFTVQAFGDLDDDGVYSTFERSGAADMSGINAAAGLYIDNELE